MRNFSRWFWIFFTKSNISKFQISFSKFPQISPPKSLTCIYIINTYHFYPNYCRRHQFSPCFNQSLLFFRCSLIHKTINWLKTMDKTKETAAAKNKGKDPMEVDNSSVKDRGFDATYLKASMILANTSFYNSVKSAESCLYKMFSINETLNEQVGYVDAFVESSSGKVKTLINGCKKQFKALDKEFQVKASKINISVALIEENKVLTDTDEKVAVSEIDLHKSLLLAKKSFKKSVASVDKCMNMIYSINTALYHAGAYEFVLDTKAAGFKGLISLVSWLTEAAEAADAENVDVPAAVKKNEVPTHGGVF
ncbi:uncharacterized protein [Rutidosis leptorrhynchoides]|uniref:uncharacterized protein n=1 Tax=Rutidosis leptorrhynchoides TaxID=125765 RepID=UPI003A98E030